jgi:hypothetical protein
VCVAGVYPANRYTATAMAALANGTTVAVYRFAVLEGVV